MAVSNLRFLSPLVVLLLLLHFSLRASPISSDFEALTAFRAASDPSHSLLSDWNNFSSSPCSWRGVACTASGRVSRLVLESLGLLGGSGSLEPLTALTQLRLLSLKGNSLSGPIPDLSDLTSLKLLFLSNNSFSGGIPATLASLPRLYRLDLSHNNLSGGIPPEFNRLTHLLTLRLESNRLSGPISSLTLPSLQDLNLSGNFFSGKIPESLSAFPESAFSNNPNLCQNCTDSVQTDPTKPDGAIASPLVNPTTNTANTTPTVVSSSPTTIPGNATSALPSKPESNSGGVRARMSTLALVAIILGDVLVVLLISLLLYCFYSAKVAKRTRSSKMSETEKIVYSSSPYPAPATTERGRMVFFEGVRRFELEDLLRASAEMLGKGGFGTAYKAVLDDGAVVAVKRLKDANSGGGRREFEQHMDVLGRVRHPNVVSLRAYYFAGDEKLLVYDYMPNGNLFWLLHGNRGPGRTPLDWTMRLKIAGGAARGLAHIHNSSSKSSSTTLKLTHGNVKSTNVLVDRSGNACVSDFGLSLFASSAPRSNGYRAPESKLTQKSDIYSFGVLLLEILTGKCPGDGGGSGGVVDLPRWVQSVVREEWTAEVFDLELMRYKDIEEEMVGLLQIAMVCTTAAPDQRPRMGHVVKMIDEIRCAEASPGHDSVSESPCVSEGTCGTSQ